MCGMFDDNGHAAGGWPTYTHEEPALNQATKPAVTRMTRDEFIAMKMLTAYRALKKEQPKKPHPDVGWMAVLLEVSRDAAVEYHEKYGVNATKKLADELYNESQRVCEEMFEPAHARIWANALAKES